MEWWTYDTEISWAPRGADGLVPIERDLGPHLLHRLKGIAQLERLC